VGDTSTQVLIGRQFGGTATLFRKEFSGCINAVETFDARLSAVKTDSNIGPILLACVYMPCDTGDTECYQNFTDIYAVNLVHCIRMWMPYMQL